MITLLHAKTQEGPHQKGPMRVIMGPSAGGWLVGAGTDRGHLQQDCAISYPNYKFSFTIWALGKAARELDWQD